MKKKLLFAVILLSLCSVKLISQAQSIRSHIRFPVWALVDAYPGTEAAADDLNQDEFAYPIARIKEIVPFLMEGFVYGWSFSYTPSDKTRGVEEYMELIPLKTMTRADGQINYSSVWTEDNRFNCWVDFDRNDYQIQYYDSWNTIQNPSIQGRGYGDLEKGFEGIKEAVEDAVKNAIREYYRDIIKNKPKEITGSVIFRKIPVIGVDSGRYVINLDFFLECGKIKPYSVF